MSDDFKMSIILTEDGAKKLKNRLKQIDDRYENNECESTEYRKKYGVDYKSFYKKSGDLNFSRVEEYIKNRYSIDQNAGLRTYLSKLLKRKKSVEKKTLKDFFRYLDLDLEDEDYKEADTKTESSHPKQPQTEPKEYEKFTGALGKLNYSQQKQLFQNTITEVRPAATFLIHGQPDFGQRWLVNQLRYKVPYHSEAWQKSIHIKAHRRNIENIWQSLAQELGTSTDPQDIVEELYEHWQKSTVILAIHEVSYIAGQNLIIFMQEFWQPLVNRVNNTPLSQRPQRRYRLLLFLIDNKNSKSKLEEASPGLLRNADSNQPDIPLELPELEPFNEVMIEDWVGVNHQVLSGLWKSSEPIESAMQNIMEGDHTPMFVLKQICECFELNWDTDIASKLAL